MSLPLGVWFLTAVFGIAAIRELVEGRKKERKTA